MKGDNFVIVNFADIQFNETTDLKPGKILPETIKRSISEAKPDIITFSGDIVWQSRSEDCYMVFCDFMDEFKIDYFIVMGNHDREYVTASKIQQILSESEYGHFVLGPSNVRGDGDYTIDINNKININEEFCINFSFLFYNYINGGE